MISSITFIKKQLKKIQKANNIVIVWEKEGEEVNNFLQSDGSGEADQIDIYIEIT